jgi:hypothetical protein
MDRRRPPSRISDHDRETGDDPDSENKPAGSDFVRHRREGRAGMGTVFFLEIHASLRFRASALTAGPLLGLH